MPHTSEPIKSCPLYDDSRLFVPMVSGTLCALRTATAVFPAKAISVATSPSLSASLSPRNRQSDHFSLCRVLGRNYIVSTPSETIASTVEATKKRGHNMCKNKRSAGAVCDVWCRPCSTNLQSPTHICSTIPLIQDDYLDDVVRDVAIPALLIRRRVLLLLEDHEALHELSEEALMAAIIL